MAQHRRIVLPLGGLLQHELASWRFFDYGQ
jgi:hypothetical protein